MNYELAKQLKDAGFPQKNDIAEAAIAAAQNREENPTIPTLSEVIEASEKPIQFFIMPNGHTTAVSLNGEGLMCMGKTPEEAVARLWLALHSK